MSASKLVPPLCSPQHQTERSASAAQLKFEPFPATAVTPAMPTTGAGGQLDSRQVAGSPIPSCPLLLSPQQITEPLRVRAQACTLPHAMATASFTPKIVCGVERSRSALPNRSPQHTTAPFRSTAHANAVKPAPLPSPFQLPPALT